MRKLTMLLLTGFFGCAALAQNSGNTANTAGLSDVKAVNQSLYQAFLQEDAATMEKMMGDSFVLINNDGNPVDRYTLIGAFRDGYVTIEEAEVESSNAQTYGDVAVVTGIWKMKGSVQGSPISTRNAFTTVYSKQNGNWKAVNSQLTAIKP